MNEYIQQRLEKLEADLAQLRQQYREIAIIIHQHEGAIAVLKELLQHGKATEAQEEEN